MGKKGFATLGIVMAVIVILAACVGLWYLGSHRLASYQPGSSSTSTPASTSTSSGAANAYGASVADDSESISITNNGAVIKTITLHDIAPFDTNDSGASSNPLVDYQFNANTFALDASHAMLYFSVYNATTAGNANANRALFSYNIQTGKLTLLKTESYTISFSDINPSPDGNFIAYAQGTHSGICYDSIGVEIYNVKNQTTTADIFLPAGVVGVVSFDHWVSAATLAYNEETYPTINACLQDGESNPNSKQKTYTIASGR